MPLPLLRVVCDTLHKLNLLTYSWKINCTKILRIFLLIIVAQLSIETSTAAQKLSSPVIFFNPPLKLTSQDRVRYSFQSLFSMPEKECKGKHKAKINIAFLESRFSPYDFFLKINERTYPIDYPHRHAYCQSH